MRQVYIMSGVSGSGKSTHANKLAEGARLEHACVVVSADDYFMSDGVYKFDPRKLGDAHGQCFRYFIASLQTQVPCVIVDNTNTTTEEIAPYVLAATAFGYEAEIVTIMCDNADICRASNRNTHNVPLSVCAQQCGRILSRKLPRYWNETTVPFAAK